MSDYAALIRSVSGIIEAVLLPGRERLQGCRQAPGLRRLAVFPAQAPALESPSRLRFRHSDSAEPHAGDGIGSPSQTSRAPNQPSSGPSCSTRRAACRQAAPAYPGCKSDGASGFAARALILPLKLTFTRSPAPAKAGGQAAQYPTPSRRDARRAAPLSRLTLISPSTQPRIKSGACPELAEGAGSSPTRGEGANRSPRSIGWAAAVPSPLRGRAREGGAGAGNFRIAAHKSTGHSVPRTADRFRGPGRRRQDDAVGTLARLLARTGARRCAPPRAHRGAVGVKNCGNSCCTGAVT